MALLICMKTTTHPRRQGNKAQTYANRANWLIEVLRNSAFHIPLRTKQGIILND